MNPIARPCGVCGARVTDGSSRCPRHKGRAYKLRVSCIVCGTLGSTSFCDAHKPEPYGGQRDQAARVEAQPWRLGYRDPDYHRNRQAAITRAGGHCEICNAPVTKGQYEVDHIVALSRARSTDDIKALNRRENLRVLCLGCHREKTRKAR